jgi:hypothetical protein
MSLPILVPAIAQLHCLAVPDPARLSDHQVLKKGKKKRKRRDAKPPGPYPCPLGCLKHMHLKTPAGINRHILSSHFEENLDNRCPLPSAEEGEEEAERLIIHTTQTQADSGSINILGRNRLITFTNIAPIVTIITVIILNIVDTSTSTDS